MSRMYASNLGQVSCDQYQATQSDIARSANGWNLAMAVFLKRAPVAGSGSLRTSGAFEG